MRVSFPVVGWGGCGLGELMVSQYTTALGLEVPSQGNEVSGKRGLYLTEADGGGKANSYG